MTTSSIHITKSDHEKLTRLIEELSPDQVRRPAHLHRLVNELDRAELLESIEIAPDVVTLNSRVKIREIDTDDLVEYTLVTPDKVDTASGRISVLAPLGTAMLGYRTGDTFEWPVPNGVCRARIEQVVFQPEQIMRRNANR